MKHLFITLEIQDGEREYTYRVLHTTPGNNINFAAERYASKFWGEGERERDFWWFFHEITVRVYTVIELTENEFKLMSEIYDGNMTRNYDVVPK